MRWLLSEVRLSIRSIFWTRLRFTISILLVMSMGIGGSVAASALTHWILYSRTSALLGPQDIVRIQPPVSIYANNNASFSENSARAIESISSQPVGFYAAEQASFFLDGRYSQGLVASVSPGYFTTLGVRAEIGRASVFDDPNESEAVVLSDRLRQELFGRNKKVIGRQFSVNGMTRTVVGVLPEGFLGTDAKAVAAWIVASKSRTSGLDRSRRFKMIGRARDSSEKLALLGSVENGLRATGEDTIQSKPYLRPLVNKYGLLTDAGSGNLILVILMVGLAVFVLVASSSNAGSLLLMQWMHREPHYALRTAIGATQSQIALLLLLDSLFIAVAACVGGLAFAKAAIVIASSLAPELHLPSTVVTAETTYIAIIVTLVAIGGATLVPVLRIRMIRLPALLGAHGIHGGRSEARIRSLLVGIQFAISAILICSSIAGIRLVHRASTAAAQEGRDRIFIVNFDRLTWNNREPEELARNIGRLATVVQSIKNNVLVAKTSSVPSIMSSGTFMKDAGLTLPSTGSGGPYWTSITPEYFRILDSKVVSGRVFNESDVLSREPRIVLNNSLAVALRDRGRPVGSCITIGLEQSCRTIIGVIADEVRESATEVPTYQMYVLEGSGEHVPKATALYIRFPSSIASNRSAVQRMIDEVGFTKTEVQVWTWSELFGTEMKLWLTLTSVLFSYGIVTLLISFMGAFSIVTTTVQQRRRELGLRMALGASRWAIVSTSVRRVVGDAGTGIVVGTLLAYAIGTLDKKIGLVSIPLADMSTVSLGALLTATLVVAASLLATWRIAREEPSVLLQDVER